MTLLNQKPILMKSEMLFIIKYAEFGSSDLFLNELMWWFNPLSDEHNAISETCQSWCAPL